MALSAMSISALIDFFAFAMPLFLWLQIKKSQIFRRHYAE